MSAKRMYLRGEWLRWDTVLEKQAEKTYWKEELRMCCGKLPLCIKHCGLNE